MSTLYCSTRWDGNQLNTIIRQCENQCNNDDVTTVSSNSVIITILAESIEDFNKQLTDIMLQMFDYFHYDNIKYKHLLISETEIPMLVQNNNITYLD